MEKTIYFHLFVVFCLWLILLENKTVSRSWYWTVSLTSRKEWCFHLNSAYRFGINVRRSTEIARVVCYRGKERIKLPEPLKPWSKPLQDKLGLLRPQLKCTLLQQPNSFPKLKTPNSALDLLSLRCMCTNIYWTSETEGHWQNKQTLDVLKVINNWTW